MMNFALLQRNFLTRRRLEKKRLYEARVDGVCGTTTSEYRPYDDDICAYVDRVMRGMPVFQDVTEWREADDEHLPCIPPIPAAEKVMEERCVLTVMGKRCVLTERIRNGLKVYHAAQPKAAVRVPDAPHYAPPVIDAPEIPLAAGMRRVECPVCFKRKDIPIGERAFCYHPISQTRAMELALPHE